MVPSWPRFEKSLFLVLFLKLDKISYDFGQTSYQNTSFIISFLTTMCSPFIFVKKNNAIYWRHDVDFISLLYFDLYVLGDDALIS